VTLLFGLVFAADSEPPAQPDQLVAANTDFAFDLMSQVASAKPDGNIFISPYSVSCALQMTAAGARGETRTEMEEVLKTGSLSMDALNVAFKDLNQKLGGRQDVTLNLANGLWCQQGFKLKRDFVDTSQRYFNAGVANVDFENPHSADVINDWADKQTQGKVKGVVSYPFPPLTRLILANAIYFKGKWVEPFKRSATRRRPFYLASGQSIRTPMMAQEGSYIYQETADFQAIKLPYKGDLQMELYLPQTNSNPVKFLSACLQGQTWQKIQSGFGRSEGEIMMPKFKLEFSVLLNDPLKALGMKDAFGAAADFPGIADAPLNISEVKQKSYVAVDEQGTEAAAVTVVGVTASAVRMPPPNRFTMILDRPFFFVISDSNTGSILFMGIVNDPAGAE